MREIAIYREVDPKPGEVLEGIYPGKQGSLPRVGEACSVDNDWTGSEFTAVVVSVNRKLHVYDVRIPLL